MDHYISPNGKHLIHATQRVVASTGMHNVGEVFGLDPEEAALAIKKGGAEYAARVTMKRDAPHWAPKHNIGLKSGRGYAVPVGYGKQLISDGIAEYTTPDLDAKAAAAAQAATREHVESMAGAAKVSLVSSSVTNNGKR